MADTRSGVQYCPLCLGQWWRGSPPSHAAGCRLANEATLELHSDSATCPTCGDQHRAERWEAVREAGAQRQRERAALDWQQRALPWLRTLAEALDDPDDCIDPIGCTVCQSMRHVRALLAEAATGEEGTCEQH